MKRRGPLTKKTTPEEKRQLRANREYPVDVYYASEIVGKMNKRGEVIFNDFKYTSSILKGMEESKLGIFDTDRSGNFTVKHVEIRKTEE